MSSLKFGHLHVKTPDPEKTAKWWADNLGAKILSNDLPGKGFKLELDGIKLNITPLQKEQTRAQSYGLEHIALNTDNLSTMIDKLKTNGARFLEETKGGQVFLETPEGVQLELSLLEK